MTCSENGNAIYIYFSAIKAKPVDWLWYPYIPYGKLTLLQGDPGEGKSTFMIYVIAAITTGKAFPDGFSIPQPQTVVYQCAEDNLEDTIKPRLISAGADCDKVIYIQDENHDLTIDDERIGRTIQETGARLFILDPIQSFLSQDGDFQNAIRMRALLGKLCHTAAQYACAIVLIGHMNKGNGGKKLYRSLGSIDIAAIARSVLMIERDDINSDIRYMYPIKSSLAPEGPAIGFTFDQEIGFQWIGLYSSNDDFDDQENSSKGGKLSRAGEYLEGLLSRGDLQSSAIISLLSEKGFSERTIYTAKKNLLIKSYRKANAWYWSLADRPGRDILDSKMRCLYE